MEKGKITPLSIHELVTISWLSSSSWHGTWKRSGSTELKRHDSIWPFVAFNLAFPPRS